MEMQDLCPIHMQPIAAIVSADASATPPTNLLMCPRPLCTDLMCCCCMLLRCKTLRP